MSIAEKVEANIRGTRLESTERARSNGGMLNRTSIVWLTENSIPRSRKRRNSGGLRSSGQSPPGYGFYVPQLVDFLSLTFNHSGDPEGRWKENGNGGQNDGEQADGHVFSRIRHECH
jgi:hypothetical protein